MGRSDSSALNIQAFSGTSSEQDQLHRLAEEWRDTQSFWPPDSILSSLKQPDMHLWYAQLQNINEWSGMILMRVVEDEAELLYIHTAAHSRGRGIGTAMLKHIQKELGHKSAKIFLEVRPSNIAAQALYTSLGFLKTGRRKHYYKDGEDALIFEIAVK